MMFKTISFIFPRPLGGKEEDMLVEASQAIAKGARDRLKRSASQLKLQAKFNKAAGLGVERYELAEENFNQYFRLVHPAPTTYTVMIAASIFSFMDIKIYGKLIASYQKKLLDRTENFILDRPVRDMGFGRKEVQVVRGETEAD